MAVSRHNLPQLRDEAIVGSDAGSLVPDQAVGLAVAVLAGGHQEGDHHRGGPAQYGTVQYILVQHSTAQYSTVSDLLTPALQCTSTLLCRPVSASWRNSLHSDTAGKV